MRFRLCLFVAVTTILTAASPAHAGRATHSADDDVRRVEQLLHATPLNEFWQIMSAGDPWLDTTTDWCSAPLVGSTGRSFDFKAACRRHDFGYRNLHLLDRRYHCAGRPAGGTCATPGRTGRYWTASSRKRVDQQFLSDMKGHCRSRPWHEEATCLLWAQTFYAAVRMSGT